MLGGLIGVGLVGFAAYLNPIQQFYTDVNAVVTALGRVNPAISAHIQSSRNLKPRQTDWTVTVFWGNTVVGRGRSPYAADATRQAMRQVYWEFGEDWVWRNFSVDDVQAFHRIVGNARARARLGIGRGPRGRS